MVTYVHSIRLKRCYYLDCTTVGKLLVRSEATRLVVVVGNTDRQKGGHRVQIVSRITAACLLLIPTRAHANTRNEDKRFDTNSKIAASI